MDLESGRLSYEEHYTLLDHLRDLLTTEILGALMLCAHAHIL